MIPKNTSTDMKDMPLPTAYFVSNRSKDVDVNIKSYADIDFADSVSYSHSISGYAFMQADGLIVGSRGLKQLWH